MNDEIRQPTETDMSRSFVHVRPEPETSRPTERPSLYKLECPECHSENVEVTGHCFLCHECGYSLCSV